MHSIIQNLEVKIYVLYKFKRQNIKKLKITPTCFGSYVIHHQGVQSCAWLKLLVVIHRYFVVCLVGVWQRNFEPVLCMCTVRPDSICSCSKAVYKPVRHITLLNVQWINSWWWTEELSETCKVSCQNKFVKLVHLVGFIVKKFVTMHGPMNVQKIKICFFGYCNLAGQSLALHLTRLSYCLY
jgi:hypothetical protein